MNTHTNHNPTTEQPSDLTDTQLDQLAHDLLLDDLPLCEICQIFNLSIHALAAVIRSDALQERISLLRTMTRLRAAMKRELSQDIAITALQRVARRADESPEPARKAATAILKLVPAPPAPAPARQPNPQSTPDASPPPAKAPAAATAAPPTPVTPTVTAKPSQPAPNHHISARKRKKQRQRLRQRQAAAA